MSVSTPIRLSQDHQAAILEAEARRLAHTLDCYGALTRCQLARLSGADRWSRGRFLRALDLAEQRGLIRDLGHEFYAPVSFPRASSALV